MPYPAIIAPSIDQPVYPGAITDLSAQTVWESPLSPPIEVYGGNWFKIFTSFPQQGSGSNGQYYVRAWKSTDLGLTWTVCDSANSPKLNTGVSPFNISSVRLADVLHTVYQYSSTTPSAQDFEFRISPFDLATETWGAAITGGPNTGCRMRVGSCGANAQLESGIAVSLVLDPAGTGFIVSFISAGAGNPNVAWTNADAFLNSYVTCTFGGTWGSLVQFAQINTYGSAIHGSIVVGSRVHFFFEALTDNDGTFNTYELYECSLSGGVLTGYHLITNTVFPMNTCGAGFPRMSDGNPLIGNPVANGTEVMIPYIGVFNTGASTPYDGQQNTKIFVAHFTSGSSPSFTLKAVTTSAAEGPSAGAYYGGGAGIIGFNANPPSIGISGTQIAIGWAQTLYLANSGTIAPDNPANLYYSQYDGSAWTAPTLAFTTPTNAEIQWVKFTVIDTTHVGWIYEVLRTGESAAVAPIWHWEFYLAILSAPPTPFTVSCGNPPDGTVGVAYDHVVPHTGGSGVITFTIDSGSLPPGLLLLTHLSPSNYGSITGTPTLAGTYTFVIKATDALANEALTGTCSITIAAAAAPVVSCNNPPQGYVDIAYDHFFTASGGTPPYTFSIFAGALPDGLSLDGATGEVTGTPTLAGSFDFTVRVTDFLGATDDIDCNITIIASPVVNCNNPPDGTVGVAYTHSFSVTGGVAPFVFALVAGGVPGLAIDGTGALSGIPTTAGTFGFTIQVTDFVGRTSTVICSITIVAAPPLAMNCNNPPTGTINVPYSHQLTISGGVGPYIVIVLTGAFPPGLNISATGLISGLPTAAGLFVFTIRVFDSQPIPLVADLTCSILIQMGHATCPDLDNPQIPGTIVPIDAETERYLRNFINDHAILTPSDQNS